MPWSAVTSSRDLPEMLSSGQGGVAPEVPVRLPESIRPNGEYSILTTRCLLPQVAQLTRLDFQSPPLKRVIVLQDMCWYRAHCAGPKPFTRPITPSAGTFPQQWAEKLCGSPPISSTDFNSGLAVSNYGAERS